MTQGMSGRDLQQLARSARSLAYPSEPEREHFLEAAASSKRVHATKVDAQASWETLVLDETVLDRLKLSCNLLRDAEKWRAQGVSIPQNLLLIGPPGVGKPKSPGRSQTRVAFPSWRQPRPRSKLNFSVTAATASGSSSSGLVRALPPFSSWTSSTLSRRIVHSAAAPTSSPTRSLASSCRRWMGSRRMLAMSS